MSVDGAPGSLDGVRVVELASEYAAFAGKLLADLGADVIVVEPPGGHHTRRYGPFLDDVPGDERSLWWWFYNEGKRGVVVDLDDPDGAAHLRALVAGADVVLEGEPPDRLAALGLDHTDLRAARPELIWVSVTPFGRDNPRSHEQAVDLTVLAGGGPVWNCGYDDHSLPPVRGGGNQGYHTACLWAVMATMTALLVRETSGVGQHVDVSMHAAANVTTEAGSYEWLVARATVQRQTCRHAAVNQTAASSLVEAADGRDVHTGVPPRSAAEFQALVDWLAELGLRDEFGETFFLEMAVERGGIRLGELNRDVETTAMFAAGRDALAFIASRLPAYDFFVGAQRRGIACGLIAAPEEVLEDEHFRARGFPVEVEHEDLGRSFVYPGAPFHAPASPWRVARRAPHVGEHDDEVLGPAATAPAAEDGAVPSR